MSGRPSRLPALREDRDYQALEESIKGSRGRVPTPFRVWMESPELARCLQPLGAFLAGDTSLSKVEAELVILFVARRWRADYVFDVHATEAEHAGMRPSTIDALRESRVPAGSDARMRSMCRLLASLDESASPDDATFCDAVEALGHRGLAEVLAIAGYFTAVGLAMKVYDVPLPKPPR